MSAALAYNGLALDRVLGRRDAPEWIEAVLACPASRVIPFWRDGCLVRDLAGPRPVVLGAQAAAADETGPASRSTARSGPGSGSTWVPDVSTTRRPSVVFEEDDDLDVPDFLK